VKPADFFVGVLDFFAILLPGSLATWLVTQYIPSDSLRTSLTFGLALNPGASVFWAAFLLSSYLLGHFVFMAGSKLDTMYDRWRDRTKPKKRDKTFLAAEKLHKTLTEELTGGEFSTLKWAKAYVQLKAPQSKGEIDRLEADSKFFRSMVVILVFAAAHFLLKEQSPVAGVIVLIMVWLSYRRYIEQRWKMTELIYGTAVIVHAAESSLTSPKDSQPRGGAVRA
jgi:hypothetical protein